ncbi:permease [Desulfosporosinus sp. SB140]|uniref:permease n=1 Tax=Desulfosporosinus paludis TaxID=3115649 RepID=UPI00388D0E9F
MTKKVRTYFPYVLLFAIIFLVGVWYVKWNPYYHKAFLAASKHSIGDSIISGKAAAPPAPSWSAAWNYTVSYFKAVWQAVILGLLLGSLVQILLPKNWIPKIFGRANFKSTALAGIAGIPSMMCTCCSAPVVVGLRQRKASVGAALAYWLGNPVLNPATIIFMGFVLSWKFALLRIIAGVIMVFGIGYFANRWARDEEIPESFMSEDHNNDEEQGNLLIRWMRALLPLIRDTIPAYFIVVVILGAVRAWLFPVIGPAWANSLLVMIGLAVAGTLFIIPTAGEIPIVQSLMAFGLGVGPGVALLMTLPAVSLPSLLMVKRVFSTKVLLFVATSVALVGIFSGAVAMLFF